jgi:hypothetical protein
LLEKLRKHRARGDPALPASLKAKATPGKIFSAKLKPKSGAEARF